MNPTTAEEDAYARIAKWMKEALAEGLDGVEPPDIEPGSSLAKDDELTPGLRASELAWIGISAAREHLYAAALIWYSHPNGVTMPTAYGTLLRTAAIGASNAYWILKPHNRDERLGRVFALAEENFKHANDMIEEALETANAMGFADAKVMRREREKAARWVEYRESAKRRRIARGNSSKFVQTRVIRWAGSQLLTDDASNGGNYALIWRFSSADAHALSWQRMIRGGASGALAAAPSRRDGTKLMRDTQSTDDLLLLLETAKLTNIHALALYEQRRRAPDS